VAFPGEFWPCLFMVTMALSNGYVSTLAMIYGPQQVVNHGVSSSGGSDAAGWSNSEQQSTDAETAGSIMILALTLGLTTGSALSYLMAAIATGL
jgi:hypothetical protein